MPEYHLTLGGDGTSLLRRVDRRPQVYVLGADPTLTPAQRNAAAKAAVAAAQQRSADVTGAQKTYKREMVQAAIKVAATQTVIEGTAEVLIAIGIIPIVGWVSEVIGLVLAVIAHFNDKRIKRDINSIMLGLKRDIDVRQKNAQKIVNAAQDQMALQLLPAAQQLALSNQPIEGLGSLWTSITGAVKKVTKPAARAAVKTAKVPTKAAIDVTMKAAAGASRSVGAGGLAAQIDRDRAHIDHAMQIAAAHATADLGDPGEMAADIKHAVGYLTGDEQVRAAQVGADKVRAKVYKQIDTAKAAALLTFQSPEYQTNLVKNLAKSIRGDPNLLQEAQAVQVAEQDAARQAGLPSDTVVATVPVPQTSALTAIAAAAAAFFLLRH